MTKICTTPDCANPVAPTSKYMCRECLDKNNRIQREKMKKLRVTRKGLGQCTQCVNPAREGKTLCESCFKNKSEIEAEQYEQSKKLGLCVRCGKPTKDGNTQCESCSTKQNSQRVIRNKHRRENGICIDCGKPARKGITRCEECNRKRLNYNTERNKNDPRYIKRYNDARDRSRARARKGLTNGQNLKTSREHIVPRVFFEDLGLPLEAADVEWNIRDGVDFRENSRKGKKLTDESLRLIKEHGLPLREDWKTRYGYLPE